MNAKVVLSFVIVAIVLLSGVVIGIQSNAQDVNIASQHLQEPW
jgi:cell division protein FtsL